MGGAGYHGKHVVGVKWCGVGRGVVAAGDIWAVGVCGVY